MKRSRYIATCMKRPGDDDRDHRIKLPTFNLTVQWTIITEALNPYNHAFGGTWGGRNSTFHHNLLACNTGRNASIGMGYDFNFINNVIFNWRHRTLDGGDDTSRVNCINNYYKPGPVTMDKVRNRICQISSWTRRPDPTPRYGIWYVNGNYMDGNEAVTTDNWNGGVDIAGESASNEDADNDDHPRNLPAKIACDPSLPHGPRYNRLRPAGVRTRSRPRRRKPSQTRFGGSASRRANPHRQGAIQGRASSPTSNRLEGIPNTKAIRSHTPKMTGFRTGGSRNMAWTFTIPSLATKDCNGDGYTNIEKYLDGLDPTKKVDWKDLKNNINTLGSGEASPRSAMQ